MSNAPVQSVDPTLAKYLPRLINQVLQRGAESILVIRRPSRIALSFTQPADIFSVTAIDAQGQERDIPIALQFINHLNVADAGMVILIAFPASDGGQSGIDIQ
jgi:hypothetical protein